MSRLATCLALSLGAHAALLLPVGALLHAAPAMKPTNATPMQLVLRTPSKTDTLPAETQPLASMPMPSARNAASHVGGTPAATPDTRSHATPTANATDSDGPPNVAYYHRQSELDAHTAVLSDIEPSTRAPDEAYVVLRIRIDERGNVDDVRSMVSDSTDAQRSAVEAFSTARFRPGSIGGVPVKSELWIELKFRALDPLTIAASAADVPTSKDALARAARSER